MPNNVGVELSNFVCGVETLEGTSELDCYSELKCTQAAFKELARLNLKPIYSIEETESLFKRAQDTAMICYIICYIVNGIFNIIKTQVRRSYLFHAHSCNKN